MICEHGNSLVSLSREDVQAAMLLFINAKTFSDEYNIVKMQIHRNTAPKAITLEVCKKCLS